MDRRRKIRGTTHVASWFAEVKSGVTLWIGFTPCYVLLFMPNLWEVATRQDWSRWSLPVIRRGVEQDLYNFAGWTKHGSRDYTE
jgi:hypothetical protein